MTILLLTFDVTLTFRSLGLTFRSLGHDKQLEDKQSKLIVWHINQHLLIQSNPLMRLFFYLGRDIDLQVTRSR